MKKVIICIIILSSLFLLTGCSTMEASPDKEQALEEIKEYPGYTKSELYNKSLNWAARVFNSANDVIQYRDEDAGQIICKGRSSIFDLIVNRYFDFTMIMDLKDGKIRVRFENITSQRTSESAGPDMAFQWDKVEAELINIKEDLFATIIEEKNNDDW